MASPTGTAPPTWHDRPDGLRSVRLARRGTLAPAGPYAVVDVETTGLDPSVDRVIEVAVVRCDAQGRVLGEWSTLVHPERDPGPTAIHGITATHLDAAPTFADVLPELEAQLAGTVVTAHNLPFDAAFLTAEWRRAGGAGPSGPGLCTLRLARSLYQGRDGYSLAACCSALGIDHTDAHRALPDARVTAAVLGAMLRTVPSGRPWPWARRLRLA